MLKIILFFDIVVLIWSLGPKVKSIVQNALRCIGEVVLIRLLLVLETLSW